MQLPHCSPCLETGFRIAKQTHACWSYRLPPTAGPPAINFSAAFGIAIESKDLDLQTQYYFEESCLQAMYNATRPGDSFDPSAPFWIAGQAIKLARIVGTPIEDVLHIIAPTPVSSDQ